MAEIQCVVREGVGVGCFDVGCVKCSGKVIMRVHRIHTGLFNMGAW